MSENNEAKKTVVVDGIMGIKSGQTHVFNENGDQIPVTVIDIQPNYITQIKTKEKDTYNAIQVGVLPKKR